MPLTEQEEFELLSLERERAMINQETLGQQPTQQPQQEQPQQQMGLLGNITNRPAAAIRSLLQGKGYWAGAENPQNVPTFQQLALEKFAPKTSSAYINFMGGWIPSALGLVADTVTNPADVLGMILPYTPVGKGRTLGGIVAKSAPGQAIGRFMRKKRSLNLNPFKKPGIPQTDAFLMEQANKSYDIANDARNSINEEIMVFRGITNDTPVGQSVLQEAVDDLFYKSGSTEATGIGKKRILEVLPEGLTDEVGNIISQKKLNLETVYKIKDSVRKYIKPRTWSDYRIGNPVTPDQEKLVTSYFKLDKIIDDSLGNASLVEEKAMLDYLNQKASDVYDLTREVKKMVSSGSKIIRDPTKLLGAFIGGEEKAGKRAVLKGLSEIEPKMNEVIETMAKFRNSIQGKQLLKRLLKVGATAGGIKYGAGLLK